MTDDEANRFSARAARYARVGANVGGIGDIERACAAITAAVQVQGLHFAEV